ncbi:MAG: molecular chaperone TorD family protein [candidate division Zixibacteria bacterium]
MRYSDAEIYDMLAGLLTYPESDYHQKVIACSTELETLRPSANHHVRKFADYTEELPVYEIQELFTRTFDINPVCALEVGWQLYGENYERGNFMVKVRRKIREFGLTESGELPDHLAHILRILGRMERDEAHIFTSEFIMPALDKMIKGLEGKNNPYEGILIGIRCELDRREKANTGDKKNE